jgi:CheY-like chemotaxis protein
MKHSPLSCLPEPTATPASEPSPLATLLYLVDRYQGIVYRWRRRVHAVKVTREWPVPASAVANSPPASLSMNSVRQRTGRRASSEAPTTVGVSRVHGAVAVVDDDESVRLATVMLVASLGLQATGFSSAEEFLASVALDEACCLILDVNMPTMNGLELQVMLHRRRPELPVIFITAFPSEEIEQQAKAGGAICFLVKPFKSDQLVQCIEAALSRRSDGEPAG